MIGTSRAYSLTVRDVGKHALVVQLRELVQLRYSRCLVIRGQGRGKGQLI